jgi:hypothetical protein
MSNWTVYVELEHVGTSEERERLESRLRSHFGEPAQVRPVTSGRRISIRDVIAAPLWEDAQRRTLYSLQTMALRSPAATFRIVVMHVNPVGYESIPALAGVREAAELLGVKPQRVRQLVARPDFPRPVETLRMGPVFMRHQLEEFLSRWTRRRPPPDADLTARDRR